MSLFWVLICSGLLINGLINVIAVYGEPGTAVGRSENTYVHVSAAQDQILLYAIYINRTGLIQGYVLRNNTYSPAFARLKFVVGDDIDIDVGPREVKAVRVPSRGYLMTPSLDDGGLVDANVRENGVGHSLPIHPGLIVSERFPLPTNR